MGSLFLVIFRRQTSGPRFTGFLKLIYGPYILYLGVIVAYVADFHSTVILNWNFVNAIFLSWLSLVHKLVDILLGAVLLGTDLKDFFTSRQLRLSLVLIGHLIGNTLLTEYFKPVCVL